MTIPKTPKRVWIALACWCLATSAFAQLEVISSKPIEVFHGKTSYITYDGSKRTNPMEVLCAEGTSVTIEILNANHLLYQYEAVIREIEIKNDMPDVGNLLEILNGLAANPLSSSRAVPRAPATLFYHDYLDAVTLLKGQIENVQKIIRDSDSEKQPVSDFIVQIENISSAKNNFNDPKLEDHLIDLLKSDATTGDPDAKKFMFDALEAQAKLLAKSVTELRASLTTRQSFIYKFKTGKKPFTISIIAKPLKGITYHRAIDTIAQVLVHPYITSSWEIIPTFNLVYATQGKDFKVENDLITEAELDDVTFRYGFFVVRNIWNWGRYKEVRCGLGAGFTLRPIKDQKILDNLQAGFFTNIKDQIKLGVGIGFAQVPKGLSQSAVGKALPPDISSIDEIITYKNRPAAFVSITIFGFKF
jgi:DNA-binding FrmR family transcriptional regulator